MATTTTSNVSASIGVAPIPEPTPFSASSSSSSSSRRQPTMPRSTSTTSSLGSNPSSVLEVINVLSSYTANHERLKVLRVSLSVIRFLSILNFVYTILGGTFLLLALCKDWTPQVNDLQRAQFFKIGLFVSIFAPLATCVDLMALRGLHSWRRAYLLPWLALYGFVDVVLFAHALSGIFHSGFSWTYLVLMLCVFCLYSAWRHLRRQYTEMMLDPPTCRTIEQLASDIRTVEAQQTQQRLRENDLPPKYEDLVHMTETDGNHAADDDESSPPGYSDVAAAAAEEGAAATGGVDAVVTVVSEQQNVRRPN